MHIHEHWYSPILRCWFIAIKKNGELINVMVKSKKYCLTFSSERALLNRFPHSVKTELM